MGRAPGCPLLLLGSFLALGLGGPWLEPLLRALIVEGGTGLPRARQADGLPPEGQTLAAPPMASAAQAPAAAGASSAALDAPPAPGPSATAAGPAAAAAAPLQPLPPQEPPPGGRPRNGSAGPAAGAAAPAAGVVLYVVATFHKNYGSRVRAIMDTWASSLGDRLLLVGDLEPEDSSLPVVLADWCPMNPGDHAGPHVCKLLQAIYLARERMVHRGLAWAMILDDDVYVRVPNVDAALATRQTDRMATYGCPTCAKRFRRTCGSVVFAGGYCGGCGIFLNLPALEAVIGNSTRKWLQVAKFYAKKPKMYGDLLLSCMLRAVNCTAQRLAGLHDRGYGAEEYVRKIHGKEPVLSFHRTKPDTIRFIHKEFTQHQQQLSGGGGR